jgi:hypothetical protein
MFSCAACHKRIGPPQYCGDIGSVTFCSDCMRRHREALAEGLKDETCAKCGAIFYAHIHFVRCEAKPCPMVSTKDPRTIFERLESAAPAMARDLSPITSALK